MATEVEPDVKLEIAHVLTIDIVAYSTLLIDEQSRVMRELNRVVRNARSFRAAEAAGKLTSLPTGDGMALVFFGDPEAPVECAMEIASALKAHPEITMRMGIHSGPISQILDVNDHANVAGAGIDMAQRVMDCGDAGHILVSKRVADDLSPYPRWHQHLHDLGDYEVKHGRRIGVFNFYTDELGNSAKPQKLQEGRGFAAILPKGRRRAGARSRKWIFAGLAISVAFAGAAWTFRNAHSLSVREKSIAVLPFENRSEDKANAYFADGIQDEILTRLAHIADLTVISRTSTQHYKSAPESLRKIARQLNVAYIVEGSVQKSGDAVRINVQLIDAMSDRHVWADTFDRKLTDIFSVESDVAKAVADQLRAQVTGQEERIIAAKATDNVEAYDAYLRGVACYSKTQTTPTNALDAQKYFRTAVRLDPSFALAWAMLSLVDAGGYITQNLQPTVALREEARQAAARSLALQPNLGEGVLATGFYHYACLKDYDTAVRYLEQARGFLPNNSQIPAALAYVARRRGDWTRSDAYFNEAERRNPRDTSLLAESAYSYIARRRFREATAKLEQILSITPRDVDAHALRASIAQAEGDLLQASTLLDSFDLTAAETQALEVQIYQMILERRPARIVPRLKEILAKPDPALGFINGELRFWLGWAQQVAGDDLGAQQTWRQARTELEPFLREQPDNYSLIGDLALTMMGLGDKAAALRLAEQAMAANPIEKDAMRGPAPVEILARVAAGTGEPDRAIAALEKLLSIPYAGPLADNAPLTPALLRVDPMFDKLRTDARFQKLVLSLERN